MNKTTRNVIIGAIVLVGGYMLWQKYQASKRPPMDGKPKPNEPKANAIGSGGVVLPKGKKPELLMSSPGVCGWYYQGDDGDLVYIGPAQCPQSA